MATLAGAGDHCAASEPGAGRADVDSKHTRRSGLLNIFGPARRRVAMRATACRCVSPYFGSLGKSTQPMGDGEMRIQQMRSGLGPSVGWYAWTPRRPPPTTRRRIRAGPGRQADDCGRRPAAAASKRGPRAKFNMENVDEDPPHIVSALSVGKKRRANLWQPS
jgi:hypothetical protein